MGVGADRQQSGAFVHVLCKKGKDSIGDAPVIGAICMDQIAIDLTDLKTTNIDVGCVTELLSARTQSKASLSHVAHVAGIVPHAVISRISTRVTRTYRSEGLQIGARERAKSALGM
jgi:alanine racemase